MDDFKLAGNEHSNSELTAMHPRSDNALELLAQEIERLADQLEGIADVAESHHVSLDETAGADAAIVSARDLLRRLGLR